MRIRTPDDRRTFTELARRAQIAQCAAEAIAALRYGIPEQLERCMDPLASSAR